MKKNTLLFCLLFCFVNQFIFSQEKVDPSDWTVEDLAKIESMSSVSVSPNNQMVLWTKRKPIKKKDRFISDIYVTRLDLKKGDAFRTIQLTNGEENDYSPIFSRDSESIYFLSSREKGNKLWKLSIFGGEPVKVKEFKNGISRLQWQNENTLLFVSNDGKTLYEQLNEKKKDNSIIVEDTTHWKPTHIYAFNLKDQSVRRITNNIKNITSSAVSPDGNWLFYGVNRSKSYSSDAQLDPFYYLQNLQNGEVKQIITDKDYPIRGVRFSRDNKGFYFMSEFGSDPQWNGAGIQEIYYYQIANDQYDKIDLKWDLGAGGGYSLVGNDIVVGLSNKTTFKMAYYKKKGKKWTKLPIDFKEKNDHVGIYTFSEDGTKIIYNYSTASKLPSYHIADVKENKITNEKTLIKLNTQFSKKSITRSEVITWKGYKGEEVTGILYYPKGYEEGKKYPLMLSIHGGPSSATLDRFSENWSSYPNILSQNGMFILKPNYHGSNNHGLAYVESIKQNYYEPELDDIIKGINLLAEQGKIDKQQLGTMGWSNGAIITTMLTVRYPNMFKVAAAGAGDVNWTSDFGTCGFGVQFDQSYFGGAPWDDKNGKTYNENYLIKSPLFEIEKVRTPTIIFHGSEDRAVPRDQGWEYYRGLQQVGKAPVKFLWFPGQPHGLRKITHQQRKLNEEIAWIKKFLLNKITKKNEAVKKGSPLAQVFKLQEFETTTGLFGQAKNGNLLPEVKQIKKDSISIGIFELTNAQFQAYRGNHRYDAGKDNYPAIISASDAVAYLKWLSNTTGDLYRLPNKKEGKALHQFACKNVAGENTLNYWAGYQVTKGDVSLLREKLKDLNTSLLLPVGSRKGVKLQDAFIYDLGGNAAEHFDGGIYGFSAYDFYDVNKPEMINSSYATLRVIKE